MGGPKAEGLIFKDKAQIYQGVGMIERVKDGEKVGGVRGKRGWQGRE